MMKIERTQLLVAGAGPVGLFAALCAAKRGLDVVVIERTFRGAPRGHTTLLHPGSMRLLADLGLAPLLLRAGQLVEHIELEVNTHRRRLELPFPAVSITQTVLEEALLQVLHKEEVDLRATCVVGGIERTDTRIRTEVIRHERVVREASDFHDEHWERVDSSAIDAEFLIGTDGRGSHVRRSLGIRADAVSVDRYAMFEFASDSPPVPKLAVHDERSHLLTPLVDRRVRCSFQLAPRANVTADLAYLTQLLAERAPEQPPPRDLDWSAIIDFETALADCFGQGRVWLAGDAAHTTSPLGVQSMNRGIAEAWQLVETMAAVSSGQRELDAVERLAGAQRADWLKFLGPDAHFELLPSAPSWLAGHARRVVSALPASGSDLEDLLRQLGIAAAP